MDELRKIIFSLQCQVSVLVDKINSLEDRIEILEGGTE